MKKRITLTCAGMIALAACTAANTVADWVQTWGAAPLPPSAASGPFPATASFSNQTIRQTIRVSVGGDRVRLRLSNEYGAKPLVIGAARVALSDEKGNVTAGTDQPVLFAGKASATIPAGAPLLSDPIDISVGALTSLSISLYLPEDTGPCTCHATGAQTGYISDSGDFTAKAFKPASTIQYRAFISGVDVETTGPARSVVILGDSISDGVGATPDANHRWPDLLANRLNGKGTKGWGVVNMGISGNRVLGDGAGQSALTRFDRDVLSATAVKSVVIFEGVNDLGIAYGKFEGPLADAFKALATGKKPTAEDIIDGYRQLIARAHARGIKVIAATITPYGGAMYYSDEGNAVREAINTWIRSGKEVDGVIDFDAVIRDPAKPTQIKDGFHAGDHLHGSDAGYAAMAAAIDLKLFP
jgi:lysophospholipase L1-like esterase